MPEAARYLMPEESENLMEGLLEVLEEALYAFRPDLKEAAGVCLGVLCAILIISLLRTVPGSPQEAVDLAGVLLIGTLLLRSANSMINLAAQTVVEISEYGKLLLPVMTAALAAQGGVTSSAALYAGTACLDAFLSGLISDLLVPMVYVYLALAVSSGAVGGDLLEKLRTNIKGLMTWGLRTVMYIFTGFLGITGVVSGSTDAATLKAAKLTISGVVPVVGGIMADASEAVLVGAGTVKNAAGLYGLFALLAICLGPFLRIGAHYLLLKATGTVCSCLGGKNAAGLVEDFASAMGFMLAMTGAVCLLLMISTVCFMRGVG